MKVTSISHDIATYSDECVDKVWELDGKRHREGGPAVELADGSRSWWINGKLHRADGPAIENINGNKQWYVDGRRQRVGGPAVEDANGDREWWLNGEWFDGVGFLLDMGIGIIKWDWLPVVLVVDGFEFGGDCV